MFVAMEPVLLDLNPDGPTISRILDWMMIHIKSSRFDDKYQKQENGKAVDAAVNTDKHQAGLGVAAIRDGDGSVIVAAFQQTTFYGFRLRRMQSWFL